MPDLKCESCGHSDTLASVGPIAGSPKLMCAPCLRDELEGERASVAMTKDALYSECVAHGVTQLRVIELERERDSFKWERDEARAECERVESLTRTASRIAYTEGYAHGFADGKEVARADLAAPVDAPRETER